MEKRKLKSRETSRRVEPLSFSLGCLGGCDAMIDTPTSTSVQASPLVTNSLNRRKIKLRVGRGDNVRKSWTPSDKEDGNQEFWASIREPYDYIMGTQLMPDSEVTQQIPMKDEHNLITDDMEMAWDPEDVSPAYVWSFSEFLGQYNELYEWLIQIQLKLYSHSNPPDKQARSIQQEELSRNVYMRKLFVEQGEKVALRHPSSQEEIQWRVNYLNNKWDQLQTTLTPIRGKNKEAEIELDLAHEEDLLCTWLITMEGQIQPITCRLPRGCSLHALQERYKDNQILLKDIEAHGPILKSVIRQYERSASADSSIDQHPPQPSVDPTSSLLLPSLLFQPPPLTVKGSISAVPRRAKSLEKRWHQIYLRSLEWHYYLEGVIAEFKEQDSSCYSDSEDEPLTKCRRLSTSSYSSFVSAQSQLSRRKRRTRGWSDYEANSSEGGSYIEDDYVHVTSSDAASRKGKLERRNKRIKMSGLKNTSMDTASHNNDLKVTKTIMDTAVSSSQNLDCEVNGLNDKHPSNDKKLIDNGKKDDDLIVNQKNSPKRNNCSLLKADNSSPNNAVFDCKHPDTDSDNNNNEEAECVSKKGIEHNRRTKLTPARREMCLMFEEELKERELQQIIDSAIPDSNWLVSNITTESGGSVDNDQEIVLEQDNHSEIKQTGKDDTVNEISAIENKPTSPANGTPLKKLKKSIHRLISGAEKLVRDPRNDPVAMSPRSLLKPLSLNEPSGESKQRRVKQWLKSQNDETLASSDVAVDCTNSLQDSCDASGELTTEESDLDCDNTSDSDNDISTTTQKRSSGDCLFSSENTPTVEGLPPLALDRVDSKILPGKKHLQKHRKSWSASDDFQLNRFASSPTKKTINTNGLLSTESTSNCIQASSDDTQKRYSVCTSDSIASNDQCANSSSIDMPSNTSQSPTVTSTTVLNQNSSSPFSPDRVSPTIILNGSLRKRRNRLRRRSNQFSGRRSDSGSDENSLSKLSGKAREASHISFSYLSPKNSHIESDKVSRTLIIKQSSSVSNGNPISPRDRINSHSHAMPSGTLSNGISPLPSSQSTNASPMLTPRGLNSDREASTHHEDISSLSEQAWDPYQELKYLSEPYSEDLDQDAARKLLNFGDDYSKYIDSDGSSFLGLPYRRRRSPNHRKFRPYVTTGSNYDSDSDLDNFNQVIDESTSQLGAMESVFGKFSSQATLGLDMSELVATVKTNLKCLRDILQHYPNGGPGFKSKFTDVQCLVERWESLQSKAEERHRQSTQLRQLQRQVKTLRLSMEGVITQCTSFAHPHALDDPSQIGQKIDEMKSLQDQTENLRSDLSSLNVMVHRFTSEVGASFVPLKDEMAELYRLWDEMHRRVNSELNRLQSAEATWRLWEEQKSELTNALKQDSDTLKVIRAAIDNGKLTDTVTASVHDVAMLLNERRKGPNLTKSKPISTDSLNEKDVSNTRLCVSMEGREDRLSDSGTSGYESCSSDDLSERERRLVYLRRLARELEGSLVPGSKAWNEINKTLTEAENELHDLQDNCRSLLVRTAETLDHPNSKQNRFSPNTLKRRNWSRDGKSPRSPRLERRSSKSGSSSSVGASLSRREWIWRVVRAAMPFQAALLLLFCVACLLEPNCCDSVNTFNFSFRPQFRYSHGSPPI